MVTSNSTSVFSYSGLHSSAMKALIALFFLPLIGCGGSVQTAKQTSQVTRSGVVFVGDSIFGRLVAESQFTQGGYIDAGVFGERTDQMLARFPDILSGANVCHGFQTPDGAPDPQFPYTCSKLSAPPSTVVILGGWNDLLQVDIDSTVSSLAQMVAMAQAQGVHVVICTVYPFDPGHAAPWMVPTGTAPVTYYDVWRVPLNQIIRGMQGVTVVDLDAVFAGQSDYTADGIHPTFGAGNIEMLNAIKTGL